MTKKEDVEKFLNEFKEKIRITQEIHFRDDRGKNTQAIADLEIVPKDRIKILNSLKSIDYSEGPLEETLYKGGDMWVFGKEVKQKEVYIKISLGLPNFSAICFSFHIAEYPINYPLKQL